MPILLPPINPELDLVLERTIDVPPHLVWRAWTEPALLKQWFCPAPWGVASCEIDLRPGGQFHTVMRSPEGQLHDEGPGCILEVLPNERLVWTDALGPDFRPTGKGFITAVITLTPAGNGTHYHALARHATPEAVKQHAEMGFHAGWGMALDQLVALMKSQ